jgi:hypothetical protein
MSCRVWMDEYTKWFKEEVSCKETEYGTYVNTPFLSINNDYITVRINEVPNSSKVRISDDGKTMQYLFLRDFDLSKDRLKAITNITNSLGLELIEDEIVAITDLSNFGRMFLNVIQSTHRISSLVSSIKESHQRTFRDELTTFFNENKLAYTTPYYIQGISTKHHFEFMIPRNKMVLIDPLSARSKTRAKTLAINTAFKLQEVKREIPNFLSMIILDDEYIDSWEDREVKNIFNNYVDKVFKWGPEKEEIRQTILSA